MNHLLKRPGPRNRLQKKMCRYCRDNPRSKNSDYWPLPWYFRSNPNVGWYNEVDMTTPASHIIIGSKETESKILKKIYEMPKPGEKFLYLPLFETEKYLRPLVPIRAYIRKDIYDTYEQTQIKIKK